MQVSLMIGSIVPRDSRARENTVGQRGLTQAVQKKAKKDCVTCLGQLVF